MKHFVFAAALVVASPATAETPDTCEAGRALAVIALDFMSSNLTRAVSLRDDLSGNLVLPRVMEFVGEVNADTNEASANITAALTQLIEACAA